ncbi:MAG: hypothetical protein J7K48_02640 [Thermococcus sp.]|uniref:Uncharacterized protein n=1 Tax=Thermococcus guaymasensis DSM 11113 TaxID=1432656 RepID=A0A0X1KLB1_9EURY|nr:hypothetical protein X802_07495 [Thermococcus guaymasensis DSM 11113]MCD6523882.1 hypothetical protein [Thermococcus sp.]
MRGPFPDQITVKRSDMLASEKNERYIRESREVRQYSTLETAIVVILGLLVLGFVVYALMHYI